MQTRAKRKKNLNEEEERREREISGRERKRIKKEESSPFFPSVPGKTKIESSLASSLFKRERKESEGKKRVDEKCGDKLEDVKEEEEEQQQQQHHPPLIKLSRNKSITKQELDSFAGKTVPDIMGKGLRLLFVGINPGLRSAAMQTHFAGPSNRFYGALFAAGLTPYKLSAKYGLSKKDHQLLIDCGIGISNFVPISSRGEKDLTTQEIREGAKELDQRISSLPPDRKPKVIAVLGLGAFKKGFKVTNVVRGKHPEIKIGGVETWVLGNPSGLNGSETEEIHGEWYRKVADIANLPNLNKPLAKKETKQKE